MQFWAADLPVNTGPQVPPHLTPWCPKRRWVGESVMERDGAPPWPGKDWGCRRTAGQVF